MRDLILQLSKSSIYSTKPVIPYNARNNHAELPELIEEMAEKVEIKMRTNIASMLAKTTASENT
ncbi:hypothetical protein ACR93G_24055 [Klebsiella pneumoniae]